ncbi:A24 family peptidase [Enterocloster clostridioformis]|uniref:prepilin peptidase n=1 Tax=Enterocloster clostridioformis TaxID=1531 RepID=UPI00267522F4|nr:A24 family peptidase [Enterocloster clostridioformis]
MPDNGRAIQAIVFILLLLAASVLDIKKRMVPDALCVIIALTAALSFQPQKLWGILVSLPFLLAAVFCGGMGGGDIKLMAATGIVLGLPSGILATVLGLSLVLAYSIILNLCRKTRVTAVPLVPFLSVGCVAGYLIR